MGAGATKELTHMNLKYVISAAAALGLLAAGATVSVNIAEAGGGHWGGGGGGHWGGGDNWTHHGGGGNSGGGDNWSHRGGGDHWSRHGGWGGRHFGHDGRFHYRNHFFVFVGGFYYDPFWYDYPYAYNTYYSYGPCSWLRHRVIETDLPYWKRRYQACLYSYYG